jgi:hypothetical protein
VALAAAVLAFASGCSSTRHTCSPQEAGPSPAFVEPSATQSACTGPQVQALYDGCYAPAPSVEGLIASKAGCDTFKAAPDNATCVQCMVTAASDHPWGPIVEFPNGNAKANVGGCIALIDRDATAGSCAVAVQSTAWCRYNACAAPCPDVFVSNVFRQCEDDASATVCADIEDAAACQVFSRYAACTFETFEEYFVAYGRIFCEGQGVDAGSSP